MLVYLACLLGGGNVADVVQSAASIVLITHTFPQVTHCADRSLPAAAAPTALQMNAYLQEERQRCQLLASQLGREQQGSESRAVEVSLATGGHRLLACLPGCASSWLVHAGQVLVAHLKNISSLPIFLRGRLPAWRPWLSSRQRR